MNKGIPKPPGMAPSACVWNIPSHDRNRPSTGRNRDVGEAGATRKPGLPHILRHAHGACSAKNGCASEGSLCYVFFCALFPQR